jgi:hypothetical protein
MHLKNFHIFWDDFFLQQVQRQQIFSRVILIILKVFKYVQTLPFSWVVMGNKWFVFSKKNLKIEILKFLLREIAKN